MPIDIVPGISDKTKNKFVRRKINQVGDLVDFLKEECNHDIKIFEDELKTTFKVRSVDINRVKKYIYNLLFKLHKIPQLAQN